MSRDDTLWLDAETHILPKAWCAPDYDPPAEEDVLRKVLYEHPERDDALPRAHAEALITEMDRNAIDEAVVIGLPWKDEERCWRNNEAIVDAVRRYPGRLHGVGVLPDPHRVDAVGAVERIAKRPELVGVKTIPSWQGFQLDDEALAPALERMAELGLALVPHTDHAYIPPTKGDPAYALFDVIQTHPDLPILAPHLGGLLCLYDLHPPLRGTFDNVLFIGTVPTTMTMIEFATQAVGPRSVAFGTDFPFNPSHDQATVIEKLRELDISDKTLRGIAGANAKRFLEELK